MSVTLKIENGDFVGDERGFLKTITGEAKLDQEVREVLSIEDDSEGYGSGLVRRIADDGSRLEKNDRVIKQRIRTGLDNLRILQQTKQTNIRTNDEIIADVPRVQIAVDPNDPTKYNFWVNVMSLSKVGSFNFSGRV